MCEYCREPKNKMKEICGQYFPLKPTAGFKNDRRYSSWIMKNKDDKYAGIMICTDNGNAVYFDINYCPMCGRKLNKEE